MGAAAPLEPVGEEQLVLMHGAVWRGVDAVLGKSAERELLNVCRDDVEVGFAGCAYRLEQVLPIAELLFESIDNVGTDLVAAAAGGRAQGCNGIARIDSTMSHKVSDCAFSDAACGTAPTGVNGSHCTGPGVANENREAIGSLDSQE